MEKKPCKRGRPSLKGARFFNTYKLLRCAMLSDDIEELLKLYPRFRDITPRDKDRDIQSAIDMMTLAMSAIQPPDLTRAEPLRE